MRDTYIDKLRKLKSFINYFFQKARHVCIISIKCILIQSFYLFIGFCSTYDTMAIYGIRILVTQRKILYNAQSCISLKMQLKSQSIKSNVQYFISILEKLNYLLHTIRNLLHSNVFLSLRRLTEKSRFELVTRCAFSLRIF